MKQKENLSNLRATLGFLQYADDLLFAKVRSFSRLPSFPQTLTHLWDTCRANDHNVARLCTVTASGLAVG